MGRTFYLDRMTTFPALVPSSRTFTPGEYPATAFNGYSGAQNRVRHSNVFLAAQLRLTFLGLTQAQMLDIWNHYNGRRGEFRSFALPTEVVSYGSITDYVPGNYLWRYAGPGSVEDLPCGGHNVSLTLETVPPTAASVVGADLFLRLRLSAGVAAGGEFVPGINETVTLSIDAGAAFVALNGINETITLSLETGEVFGDVEVAGVDQFIFISFATQPAANDGAPGIDETITLSLAAGVADNGTAPTYRYWRFDQLTQSSTLALEVGEFVLVNNGTYVSGSQWTNQNLMFGDSNGLLTKAGMADSILTARAFQIVTPASSAYIQYDHGSAVACTGFVYASYFRPATRHITSVRVQGSNDGTTFTTIKTFTLSAYTANNANSVNQLSPEYTFD